jgi:hypothetical protein
MLTLAQPLTQSQIDAASKFWDDGGESEEFAQLKGAFPDRLKAVRVKAIVLNELYGTNVIAIYRVATRLEELLKDTRTSGPLLVEEIVEDINKKVTGRSHYSFVAKFCHFFVDPDLPILDSYAEEMAAWHLGPAQSRNPRRYLCFCENIEMLVALGGLNCNCARLDAYLWIAGEYRSWSKKRKREISSDLKPRFERLQSDPQSEPILKEVLGPMCRSFFD